MGKAYTIPTIFTAVDRFSAPVMAMTRHMKTFGGAASVGLARAERAFSSLIPSLSSVNRLLGSFGYFLGGAVLVLALGRIIGIIMDFQQANADLNAVMTDSTPKMMQDLSDQAKKLGLTTARSATQVVGLQIELAKLGYQGPEILNMTKALVAGSIAMDAELDRTATLGGAMVRTFTKFTSADMPMIMDQMTLATLDTALSFEKLETMLPIVSGAANAVGVTFTRQLALLGKLADAGIDASSSATALRNIFIDSRRRGHNYDQILGNIAKHADQLTPAFNKFGKRGAVSAVVLANKLKEVLIEEERLINSTGTAERVMAKRLDTVKGSLTLLKSAWSGFILTLEDGTGKYAKGLQGIIDTARGMVLLSAGTSEAMDAFNDLHPEVQQSSRDWLAWLGIAKKAMIALIALKGLLILSSLALGVYSIWTGYAAATTGIFAISMGSSVLAMRALMVSTWLLTVAQRAFAFSSAALAGAMGPVGWALIGIVLLTKVLADNWDALGEAFEKGGLLGWFEKLSNIIVDGILAPIQWLFEILSTLPAVGGAFGQMAKGVERMRRFAAGGGLFDKEPQQDKNRFLGSRSMGVYEKYQALEMADAERKLQLVLATRGSSEWNGKMSVEYKGPPFLQPRSESDSVKMAKIGSTMGF